MLPLPRRPLSPISFGVNEDVTGTTSNMQLNTSLNPNHAVSTSMLFDDQGDSYDTLVASLLPEGNTNLSESPMVNEIEPLDLSISKDSVGGLDKQQQITLSLRRVIHKEFSHISWDCPEKVLPPRRVVDWTARFDPTKEGIPVDWNFVYSQLANKRTACLDRSLETSSERRLRTNQRDASLADRRNNDSFHSRYYGSSRKSSTISTGTAHFQYSLIVGC